MLLNPKLNSKFLLILLSEPNDVNPTFKREKVRTKSADSSPDTKNDIIKLNGNRRTHNWWMHGVIY